MSKKNNIGTFTITDSKVQINKNDDIKVIAFKLTAGAATYKGSLYNEKLGGNSSEITMVIGEPVTITSKKNIDNLIIDASAGTGNTIQVIINSSNI